MTATAKPAKKPVSNTVALLKLGVSAWVVWRFIVSPIAFPTATASAPADTAFARQSESCGFGRSPTLMADAHEAVEARLRSPSTASFGDNWLDGPRYRVSDDCTMHVSSYVDAQNGFGATIRSNWTVDFRVVGGKPHVTDVVVD